MRKSGGLDFEAEERHEEVQKEREIAEDWTLRQRRGRRKSKTQVGAPKRKTRHHICAKNYIKSHKPLALKLTLSRIIQVSNNLHFMKEEVLLS